MRLVFPIKDFFIAMSLIWLYLYQGLKEESNINDVKSNGASGIDKDTTEINYLLQGEESIRKEKGRFNSMMRGMSVKNDDKQLKSKVI